MIEDYTNNGVCPENCGKCCKNILPLNDNEINKIKKYIRRNNIKAINRSDGKEYSDICPFLNENCRCNIYIHRPEICKYFSCHGDKNCFHYADKKIIDMMKTFYPEENNPNSPDLTALNNIYIKKKEKAFGK